MTTQQAVALAEAGLCVAIIGPRCMELMSEVSASLGDGDSVDRYDASSMRRRIVFRSGGRLTFHRTGDDLRGHRLDVAYLTSIELAMDGRTVKAITPCFATEVRPRIGVLV